MALIISADEIKKTIPGYDPKRSDLVHRQSAKLADTQYQQALQDDKYTKVILLSGGSASGKTEFMSEYLVDEDAIILDGTLPTFAGAEIKIKKALKKGKSVTIVAVWPVNLQIAFGAFLQRERKFPDEHFYRTHSQSRKTLLEIAKSNLDVKIELYMNRLLEGNLDFYGLNFDTQARFIEFLQERQYTEEQIIQIVTKV